MDSGVDDRKLDFDELFYGLKDLGCNLTTDETRTLFTLFDADSNGSISYSEFLIAIRGKLNERRQAIVDKAFLKFDRTGDGVATIADMKNVYDAKFHPKFKSEEWTEEEVFEDFLKSFGDKNEDGCLTRDEWNDNYSAVSSSVDDDDAFVLIMKNAWKLDD